MVVLKSGILFKQYSQKNKLHLKLTLLKKSNNFLQKKEGL